MKVQDLQQQNLEKTCSNSILQSYMQIPTPLILILMDKWKR